MGLYIHTYIPTHIHTHISPPFPILPLLWRAVNKSAGKDNLQPELMKHAPTEMFVETAQILNETAKTDDYPKEIKEGILIPLQKPGKPQGPTDNLRPIILLSIIRKILAICMFKRCWHKFKLLIETSQAAYQGGRSTTEQVLTMKLLAEKTITSTDYTIHILMLDMSKAFDTVDRNTLFEDLKEILDHDELHMLKILIENVELTVRVSSNYSQKSIKTAIGVPQGDCLSPVLFILYLSQALKETRSTDPTELDHTYAMHRNQRSLIDHTYTKPKVILVNIDPKYADDISWVTNNEQEVKYIENNVPPKLKNRNLKVNESKTEHFEISRESGEEWKKAKYLGSMIDTEKDMAQRKSLALNTYNELKKVIENRKTSTHMKTRIINAFVTPIYLYNSELWTLRKAQVKEIDILQRNILRKALNIHWPQKISNYDLYKITKQKPWSKTIQERRLKWLGHLLRLEEDTPVKQALYEALRTVKRPKGRPKQIWVAQMKEDLKLLNLCGGGIGKGGGETSINFEEIIEIARDRKLWQSLIKRAMLQQSPDCACDEEHE